MGGRHNIDDNFLAHIAHGVSQSAKVGKPIQDVLVIKTPANVLAFSKLNSYKNDVRKGQMALSFNREKGNDSYYDFLGRAIDRPVHAMRKVLVVHGRIPRSGKRGNDSTDSVVRRFFHLFGKTENLDVARKLIAARREYKDALHETVAALNKKRRLSVQMRDRYSAAVKGIERVIPLLPGFYDQAASLVLRRL